MEIIEFLTTLFDTLGYSAINTARSALSTFVVLPEGHSVGNHPLISRFLRGVFQLKPPLPRYNKIWDVRLVLNFLRKLSPAKKLSLQDLTLKTCMLVALVTSQRQQTLHNLSIKNMHIHASSITFVVTTLLKQSRPGNVGFNVKLLGYPPDRRLCVYTYLIEYLSRTKLCRGKEESLFVSYKKPHRKVTKDTIARWLRQIMSAAGINVSEYKPHSIRAAAVSRASTSTVPISIILSHAGWANEKTFSKFYNKPIVRDEQTFVSSLLQD